MPGFHNYDKYPETVIHGYDGEVFSSEESVRDFFAELGRNENHTLVIEYYPGADDRLEEIVQTYYRPDVWICSEDMFPEEEALTERLKPFLTDDRVRGVMYPGRMEDFVCPDKLQMLREKAEQGGRVCIAGVGAGLIRKADTLIFCDMTRWEITLRYRRGMANFRASNHDEDTLRKLKRGFFIEWRIADKRKAEIFETIDWFADTNAAQGSVFASGNAVRSGLKQIAGQPFRLVPYFDPGVWGGTWMKEVCELPDCDDHYAWCFDGVPEENSLRLRYGDTVLELPAMDLVLYQPVRLLGMKNYCRFGAEFPIRFDFLDTMGGQNLSLQVHPLMEFIHSRYGMTYTQDESYYILDAEEDGCVWLGLKEGIDPEEMHRELCMAQKGKQPFPAERYVNCFPARKHDHFLIPAGTVHCSGAGTMVLEISATPYIFTFKLWDWDRLGLDGLPRPIHIEEGMANIQWDRTENWVRDNLVNRIREIQRHGDFREESTGLHELEFIETRRFTASGITFHDTCDGFDMGNLVEGKEAVIASPDGAFEPFTVHYAETFIVPAAVGEYTVEPGRNTETITFIKAYVRAR